MPLKTKPDLKPGESGENRQRVVGTMPPGTMLPPGQREINSFPRFGLSKFAYRFPKEPKNVVIDIGGDAMNPARLPTPFDGLKRVEQISDFHCVTTWTKRDVRWSGFRFSDFYENLAAVLGRPELDPKFVLFKGQDGYQTGMQIEDLLAPDVLLANQMDGQELCIAHGVPLRLVAPAHYGYKSTKHISRIEFWRKKPDYHSAGFKFMDHPRARVKFEERGTVFPGWVLRWLYRPLVKSTTEKFERALNLHMPASNDIQDQDPQADR